MEAVTDTPPTKPGPKPRPFGAVRLPRSGTRMRKVYDLIVEKGWDPGPAAQESGVKPQTAERVMEKFVIPNRLRARIAELEAQLAGRKSA